MLGILVLGVASAGYSIVQASERQLTVDGGMEVVDDYHGVISSEVYDSVQPRITSTSVEDGRGWWRRGQSGNLNISEYVDYQGEGHASCENGNGTFDNGDWEPAYTWSTSSVGWTVLGGNKAYYNYR